MTRTIFKSPLHLLADVALSCSTERSADHNPERSATAISEYLHAATITYSPSTGSVHSFTTPPNSSSSIASLHIACGDSASAIGTQSGPLRRSNSSNHVSCAESTSAVKRYNTRSRKKRSSHPSPDQVKVQMQMKAKRIELMGQAMKIKSLENSPVNDRQLLVLRMVYDEITMYPSEPWMVILAIALNRAFKQVKNWFSNERQKNRTGEVVLIDTKDGDRMRIRPDALKLCEHWSDQVFEEIVLVYNFKSIRQSRWEASQTATCSTIISNELS